MEPKKVPDILEKKLRIEIILVIIGIGIIFQFFNVFVIEAADEELDAIEISVTVIFGIAAIASFWVSKHYDWKSHVFGKSYFALGMSYVMFVVAEIIWHYHEVILQQAPYPSIADVFYFAFYPFAAIHLIKNSRYFRPTFSNFQKIWLILLPFSILIIYTYFAYTELGEFGLDFYYGSIFVAGAATTITFALLGATIFRSSVLGAVWLLLAVGIFLNGFADVWYYYLELFGLYSSEHVTMSLWFTSTLFIIYALYKHKNAI